LDALLPSNDARRSVLRLLLISLVGGDGRRLIQSITADYIECLTSRSRRHASGTVPLPAAASAAAAAAVAA